MGVILSVLAVSTIVGGGSVFLYKIHKHEQRDLKVGSDAATLERVGHESWEAVVDNYVYIHNAFRNDLQRIILSCEDNKFVLGDLENWRDILDLHSRVEDEIIIVALQARLKKLDSSEKLPEALLNGKDHESVKSLIGKAMEIRDETVRLGLLKELATELDGHLAKEEEIIMPLLLDSFTTRELWALDSFIVNPKLAYCDKQMLTKITLWWFGNISISEGKPLLKNFIKAGKQPPMSMEAWKELQDDIPALQKFPIEDIIS